MAASGCWCKWATVALGEVVGGLAGGLQLLEQGQRLPAHGRFDERRLVQRGLAEDGPQAAARCGDPPLAAGTRQGHRQLPSRQAGRLGRRRSRGQERPRSGVGQPTGPAILEGCEERRVVLA
jgi:hypothetical protein